MSRAAKGNNIAEIIDSARAPAYIPSGYKIEGGTLYRIEHDKEYDTPISDPLYIEAMARDDNGENWGRLLVWYDGDGVRHEWAMPSSFLAGDGIELRKRLLSEGLNIRSGRKAQNALQDYILSANPPARALSVTMPGWHNDHYVMQDNTVYGSSADRILLQTSGATPKLNESGDLESWQANVAKYARGNSRLLFAIATAFAATLLQPANEGSGGFHYSGGSSSGKTTSLRVSASVWGMELRSWRTTDNAAESWARFANDGFLPIDELGQVDGRAADQMAYMLGNGQTKGRSNRNGIARETKDFRLLFTSTGEIGLADKIGESQGKKAKAGQAVRMLEIPADAGAGYGIFENLHEFNNGDEFAKYLAKASKEHCGTAIKSFLERITEIDARTLQETVATLTAKWLDDNVPLHVDGQVKRAARRFALVAVAGEMAANWGIVPWEDQEASQAAARCFSDWLNNRGGIGSHEVQEGLKAITDFIERYGTSRFANMDFTDEKVIDRAGFKRKRNTGDWEYLIFPNVLRSQILGGSQNAQDVIKAGITCGLIEPDSQNKSSKPIELPGLGKKRMVCVFPSRLKEAE